VTSANAGENLYKPTFESVMPVIMVIPAKIDIGGSDREYEITLEKYARQGDDRASELLKTKKEKNSYQLNSPGINFSKLSTHCDKEQYKSEMLEYTSKINHAALEINKAEDLNEANKAIISANKIIPWLPANLKKICVDKPTLSRLFQANDLLAITVENKFRLFYSQ